LDWKAKALEMWRQKYTWGQILEALRDCFSGKTDKQIIDSIRSYIRGTPEYKAEHQKGESPREVTDEQILKALEAKRKPQETAEILHMPIMDFVRRVDKLTEKYNIKEANGLIWLEKSPVAEEREEREAYTGEEEIVFGLIGDTHLCNKNQQLTYLHQFYDLCEAECVRTVYHVGDISDGYYPNRPEHIYELFKVGADAQAEYIIENYPRRNGVVTKFITGNHDATHMKNGGTDIGKHIAAARDDMEYLGYMTAKIWLTPHCDLDLLHPLDGAAYALSYPVQKHIDALQGGKKPRILAFGHYHKNLYMFYRNIHAICVPCFEQQTTFMRGKRISATVGGYIVTIKCTPEGIVREIIPRIVVYADMIPDDY